MTINEQTIMTIAAEKFKHQTGVNLEAIHINEPEADYLLKIRTMNTKRPFMVKAQVKKNVTDAIIGWVTHREITGYKPPLLITYYVNPQLAERLKERDICFLDCAGNAYLKNEKLFIYTRGNTIENQIEPGIGRIFRPAGLKLIFAVLCNPGLEKLNFRKIALTAGIALGTVNWVINELKATGYLIETRQGGRKAVKKKELFEKWVEHYAQNLRPALLLGRYQAAREDWWKIENLHNEYWGGEVAAHYLTKGIKPQIITVFVEQTPVKLILTNVLKKGNDGDTEILKKFWHFPWEGKKEHLVPAILIYADLLAHPDARNTEIAKEIYEKEIIKYLKED
jgi:hypothetical protein